MWRRLTLLIVAAATAITGASAGPLDDWQTRKSDLSAKGVTPSLIYDGALITNVQGGAQRGSVYVGALHAQAQLDGSILFGAPGLIFYFDALDVEGGRPDSLVGDAQGINNIAAPPQLALYEAWSQYNSPDSSFSLLAGQYDLNSEFDRVRSASMFLNSSFGIGADFASSGKSGPSIYPDTSLGLRLAYKPAANVVWRTAILDGAPVNTPPGAPEPFSPDAGFLFVSEVAFLVRPGTTMPPGQARSLVGRASNLAPYQDKLAVGGWYYTASFADLSETGLLGNPVQHRGSAGAYLDVDKLLYRSPPGANGTVYGFLQLGYGDDRVNRFGSYLGIGVTADGFVPGRSKDEIGLAVAAGRASSHFVAAQENTEQPVTSSETAIELTYLGQLTPQLAVQPDLQYVIDPGNDPRRANALVLQVQFELSL
ncbi:MAG TPA: carbohydrate porin [Rhizomicrobium sp.]|nr:carbohydrate porin [Rhizomicrobium sp.]